MCGFGRVEGAVPWSGTEFARWITMEMIGYLITTGMACMLFNVVLIRAAKSISKVCQHMPNHMPKRRRDCLIGISPKSGLNDIKRCKHIIALLIIIRLKMLATVNNSFITVVHNL